MAFASSKLHTIGDVRLPPHLIQQKASGGIQNERHMHFAYRPPSVCSWIAARISCSHERYMSTASRRSIKSSSLNPKRSKALNRRRPVRVLYFRKTESSGSHLFEIGDFRQISHTFASTIVINLQLTAFQPGVLLFLRGPEPRSQIFRPVQCESLPSRTILRGASALRGATKHLGSNSGKSRLTLA